MNSSPAADPAAELARIEALATVLRTPCGSGSMVWRAWGQGDSDDPDHPFDADSLAAIVTEGVRQVVPGETPVRMMCFSFGSIIGGVVATNLGARVLSYTGVGAAGLGDRGPITRQLIRITPDMPPEEQTRLRRHNLGILMFADESNIDPLADHIQEINMARNRIRSRPISLSDRLARTFPLIKGRINLIWGSEDVTAVGFFDQRHALLRSVQPDAAIAMRDGIGHWDRYEDAEWFNPTALDVLRRA